MVDRYSRRGLFFRLADELISLSQEYFSPYLPWVPTGRDREAPGPLTFRSSAQTWRDQLVEVARILGIQEDRGPGEVWRQLADRLGVPPSPDDEEGMLRAVAKEMGLGTDGASYVTLLESIGEELGVSREYVFDPNKYYLSADRYWTHRIAEEIGISPVRNDDELLQRVAEGLSPGAVDAPGDESALVSLAQKLGVSGDTDDPLDLLHLIESRVRLAGR